VRHGLTQASEPGHHLIGVAGSLYLVGAIRALLLPGAAESIAAMT